MIDALLQENRRSFAVMFHHGQVFFSNGPMTYFISPWNRKLVLLVD